MNLLHMKYAVDENSHTKFHRRYAERASGAPKQKRFPRKSAVDGADHGKANASRDDHARMGISAPDDLDQAVSNTAE